MAFFERYLPDKVLEKINLKDIAIAESKHKDDLGKGLQNDILYQCKLKKKRTDSLFIMCEHQSTPDKKMPLRLLKYDIATIEQHFKQGHDKFPLMTHIVLYHGKQPWNYSTTFADYHENPEWGKELWMDMAPYAFTDVLRMSKEELKKDKKLGFFFIPLQCTSYRDPYKAFKSFTQEATVKTYFATLHEEIRDLVLIYLGSCINRNKYSIKDVVKLISRNPQETIDIMISITQAIGQEYEQRGRQEGIQEGMQQGMQKRNWEIAKNMLYKLRLDREIVAKATGLSKTEITKLQKEAKK